MYFFSKTTIALNDKYYDGQEFTIEAKNTSSENRYIQSAMLNGKPLNRFWFYHSELVNGGKLVLEMGPNPNKDWGIEQSPLRTYDLKPVATPPYVTTPEKLFLSINTVHTHRTNMLKKTGKEHISDLIYNFKERGLM